tara:strand:+ start:179 stop:403 length:225 start_codon:yes stop_codon:yes gene_type:complete
MKPKFKYKRVKVIWQDIVTDASWFDTLEDVGFLFSKDKKTVKIFTSFNYDGDKLSVGNVTVFPRKIVKKIEVLK